MSITKIFADGRIQAADPIGNSDVVTKQHLDKNEDNVFIFNVTDANGTDNDILKTISVTPMKGDIAIIRRLISEGKYSYTSYVNDGSKWEAMDGNYNANNVYFNEDLMTTSAIGNITLSNGQATINAKGKNLKEVFETIFVKEDTNISVTKPTVSYSSPTSGTPKYYCIGTDASLTVVLGFEDGKYEYGYTNAEGKDGDSASSFVNDNTTGVSLNSTNPYTLKNGNNEISPSVANGNSFNVEVAAKTDKASYTVSAYANYGDGKNPISNLKKMYPSKKIKAGTTDKVDKELFRWYVPMYAGFTYDSNLINNYTALTASQVTGLGIIKDSTAYNKTKPTSGKATGSWRQYFVAVPASYNTNKPSAKDSNNLTLTVEEGSQVTLNFGGTDIVYDVYYIHNAANYDTVDITLTW